MSLPISRMHYTDLYCAALNGGKETQEIFDRLKNNGCFDNIVERPEPGMFLADYSVSFLYPHKMQNIDLNPSIA